ncbi:MAG: hypothetical protein JXR63_01300 [Spirochaetales bacterium]|nr:hypothetical protein [Spirochaetales bacterium]
MRKIILFVCFSVFVSCVDDNAVEFSNDEVYLNKEIANEILQSYGIEDGEIYSVVHFQYGENAISKKVSNESFSGDSMIPEGPPGDSGEIPPAYKNDSQSNYSKTELIVNYNDIPDKRTTVNYISYLILLDSQYADKVEQVESTLKPLILNRERADILKVVVKN